LEKFIAVNSCPVCSTNIFDISFKKGNFLGKKCTLCGLVYLSPRLAQIDSVYTDDKTSSTSEYYKHARSSDLRTFKKRLKLFGKYSEKESLIDIGCSTGNFLEAARSMGWRKLYGIEPNENSAAKCRENGFEVTTSFLEENSTEQIRNKFHAAHIGDVIEHVPDPVETICIALKLLKPGGTLMIVTPNFKSRIAKFLQIKPLEHILYFDKKSLEYLLKKCNLDILFMGRTTREHSLKALRYSTTFNRKPFLISVISLLNALKAEFVINLIGRVFLKDELVAIAKKRV
jgi:2-polyprenyl-3-methyl-5-hydroxy-6-metoxy-1,4-benzoquinol methylase